jgi:hypothetical protein
MLLKTLAIAMISAGAVASRTSTRDKRLAPLVLQVLKPYRGWLAIVFVAMLVEIAMSLAATWPLKLVLDDALGRHHLPDWLASLTSRSSSSRKKSGERDKRDSADHRRPGAYPGNPVR